ncbi:hypothetical protein [Paracoccus salsus]|uniref:hypothetical protein n=1 Tax=Paracoccus salsus TaxID=2911061 RepID=UPI001F35DA4D|nr:hypothetical protein [Paracoccus salsus]MCF3972802.1 hypothetical protein [Paracoccus salsus]
MSFNNENPKTSAKNHRPAIIGIVVALLVAVIAFLLFMPGADEQNEGIVTTPPPGDTALTDAEGDEAGEAAVIAPDSAAPVTPDDDATESDTD